MQNVNVRQSSDAENFLSEKMFILFTFYVPNVIAFN